MVVLEPTIVVTVVVIHHLVEVAGIVRKRSTFMTAAGSKALEEEFVLHRQWRVSRSKSHSSAGRAARPVGEAFQGVSCTQGYPHQPVSAQPHRHCTVNTGAAFRVRGDRRPLIALTILLVSLLHTVHLR
ncbi:hypothetical protein J6590_016315 [Homalodisca vitripennis]|nr:hypothetical protein J6590_016315 [Homalodisca vitripennis]